MRRSLILVLAGSFIFSCSDQGDKGGQTDQAPLTDSSDSESLVDEEIEQVFVGDVGGYGITMRIRSKGDSVVADYYYHTIGDKIALSGYKVEDDMVLKEQSDVTDSLKEVFDCEYNPDDGTYDGNWIKREGGEELYFSIAPIDDLEQLKRFEEFEKCISYFPDYFGNGNGTGKRVDLNVARFLLDTNDMRYSHLRKESAGDQWPSGQSLRALGMVRKSNYILFITEVHCKNKEPVKHHYTNGTVLWTCNYFGEAISFLDLDGRFEYNAGSYGQIWEFNSIGITKDLRFEQNLIYKSWGDGEDKELEKVFSGHIDHSGQIVALGQDT